MSEDIVPLNKPGTGDFNAFRTHYRPLIRPKGLDIQLHRAFPIDARVATEHQALRQLLKLHGFNWVDEIGLFLVRNDAFDKGFTPADMDTLRALFHAHHRNVVVGRFDTRYLDSVEDIGLFLAFHGVTSVWVDGAYNCLSRGFLDLVVAADSMSSKVARQGVIRALSTWLGLEAGQLHRVMSEVARVAPRSNITPTSLKETG